jgi:hypothetical protein
MCCGIVDRDLMVRVGPEGHEQALSQPHARPMDFTGKPMRGMVYVAAAGLRTEKSLRAWVDRGLRFVTTLPPKSAGVALANQGSWRRGDGIARPQWLEGRSAGVCRPRMETFLRQSESVPEDGHRTAMVTGHGEMVVAPSAVPASDAGGACSALSHQRRNTSR